MKNNIKILVCNENQEERGRLLQNLMSFGYSLVDEAKDGEFAFDLIRRTKYDIVITDLWLSGIDGIGIIRQTKMLEMNESQRSVMTISYFVLRIRSNANSPSFASSTREYPNDKRFCKSLPLSS